MPRRNNPPRILHIDDHEHYVHTWVDVNKVLVLWLIEQGHLSDSDLPVLNHSNTKFLIAKSPDLERGEWREIAEGFHIDTQYGGTAHRKNIAALLKNLEVKRGRVTLTLINGEKINFGPRSTSPKLPDKDIGQSQGEKRKEEFIDGICKAIRKMHQGEDLIQDGENLIAQAREEIKNLESQFGKDEDR